MKKFLAHRSQSEGIFNLEKDSYEKYAHLWEKHEPVPYAPKAKVHIEMDTYVDLDSGITFDTISNREKKTSRSWCFSLFCCMCSGKEEASERSSQSVQRRK